VPFRLLFAILVGFASVSSEAAGLWGLERVRILAFLGAYAGLVLLALFRDPRLDPMDARTPALLGLLLAPILVADVLGGEVDPLDYKVVLVLPLFLFAPSFARAFDGRDPSELVWRLLTLYVLVTGLLAVFVAPDFLRRGRPDLTRVDFTGSLVAHAGLCTVYLLATLAKVEMAACPFHAVGHLFLASTAGLMTLLTGTRTAFVTCVIHLVLDVATAERPGERFVRLVPAISSAVGVLAVYTILISDDFFERWLPGSSEDWSSGRAGSQLHWLTLALDEPLGLGFGVVRERLAEGRPALDGSHLLEWPHNELLRFYVEAGLPGLLFVGLLLFELVRLAIRTTRADTRPLRRATMLAIAADMLAQSMFQNYFNSIYYSVGLLLVLTTSAASVETAPQGEAVPRNTEFSTIFRTDEGWPKSSGQQADWEAHG